MNALVDILNNGIPAEIIGGLASTGIVQLIEKTKVAFKGKSVTKDELEKMQESNEEVKKLLSELQNKLPIVIKQLNEEGKNEATITVLKELTKAIAVIQENKKEDNILNMTL
jgi:hypothetical protein